MGNYDFISRWIVAGELPSGEPKEAKADTRAPLAQSKPGRIFGFQDERDRILP
jgi:hypothetical protein